MPFSLLLLLSPPPEPGTEEAKAELDAMVAIQNVRTPEDVARAKSEVQMGLKSFEPIFGDWFTPENLPKLTKLMKQVDADTESILRPRPAQFRPQPALMWKTTAFILAVEKEDTPAFSERARDSQGNHLFADFGRRSRPSIKRNWPLAVWKSDGIALSAAFITRATFTPGERLALPCTTHFRGAPHSKSNWPKPRQSL